MRRSRLFREALVRTDDEQCRLGLIGLGTMGTNLVLNMDDHGFSVCVFNRTHAKTKEFLDLEGKGRRIRASFSLGEFAGKLRSPRSVLLMLPAGKPVDDVIGELLPFLGAGDILIDCGNSRFSDTDRRSKELSGRGVLFMGLGVSGGEKGARFGPSMMPGGPREAYERLRTVLEATAAHVNGEPCVAYMGPGSAGHYVKMIHNGIEYGLEQLIAEIYDLMKRGLGLNNDELAALFGRWNQGETASYLMEITSRIFSFRDPETGRILVDLILDVAGQKGTGTWTSQDALELGVPTPNIDIAVAVRNLSALKGEREKASRALSGPSPLHSENREQLVGKIRNGFYAAMIVTFAQGMALLGRASAAYAYSVNLADVARIWRGGCIIRAALLEEIGSAFKKSPDLPNLLLDPGLGGELMRRQEDWRLVVGLGAGWGIPLPALMSALAYYDSYRSAVLPDNLIQAQRDYFGAHTYRRVDAGGIFHTQWEEEATR
jgi:6-phosphogluconate dehydrogenase